MASIVDNLIEMGFTKEKAELAVSRCGSTNIETIMDWILSHEEELDAISANPSQNPSAVTQQEPAACNPENIAEGEGKPEDLVVRSIKCNDCGKLFQTQDEVSFHAVKSGHGNFSESVEEKKPMTEEEKKEQLSKIEAKLRQRRLEREAKEKEEELEKERNRIRSGKELLEAKKKHEELEMKKILDQRRREKEEEKIARQRVKEQIEQDKLARKAKYSNQPMEVETPKAAVPTIAATKSVTNYTEVRLQIRLTNGSALTHTFLAKEPLSAVRLYVEMNRNDGEGPFNLMTNFPKKIFTSEDYEKPLDTLGLAPSAVLIVSKAL
ncbi:UBX domain-containing protein 1-like [Coccinella septempunctata]|uniref:UBX domain-containing protein 1-like n=1 Tax=Coccinella septempunctata TaxID=41139 RepID=UPI001D089AF5|nr:UBX domain-containing protein 1-like [Coccinella septempunctata]